MERRLSAIFAADMVGYSRLMEADEVTTLERQKLHRQELIDPCFDKYRGRIFKEMGDGFLVEFPSVVEAVQCAVEIQKEMHAREAGVPEDRRIRYRIGINLGDIVVDADDIYGDGVNVASRLEALAQPEGICISGSAYDQMRSTVNVGYESLGDVSVKNISRPIRAYKVITDTNMVGAIVENPRQKFKQHVWVSVAATLLLVVVGVSWWWPQPLDFIVFNLGEKEAKLSGKPSIAVLPFQNIGGDPDQEYFVDGVTDDIITDLSKFSSLFVIARNSTFAYKGQRVEPEKIANEFGVRYILIGSVRASNDRLRINSQLVDTKTGGQIWADRFDRPKGDVFAIQDDVTENIVSALALKLTPEDETKLKHHKPETSPEVYDLYLRGVEGLRQFTPESITSARSYFLRALSIDPDFARAYATTAFSYTAAGIFFQEDNTEDALDNAIRYGRKALELDPTLPQGHFAMAIAYLRLGKHSDALKAAKDAVRYDPNYADGYVALANVLMFMGNSKEAIRKMQQAMELNPRYSAAYIDILGRAYFVDKNLRRAEEQFKECIARDPVVISCHAFLASTYALLGNTAAAQWQVEEVKNLKPDFAIGNNNISPQFDDPVALERFENGLKAAGLK